MGVEELAAKPELWIDELFQRISLRVGLTAWSGNQRMMKLADRLFKCEGRISKSDIGKILVRFC